MFERKKNKLDNNCTSVDQQITTVKQKYQRKISAKEETNKKKQHRLVMENKKVELYFLFC